MMRLVSGSCFQRQDLLSGIAAVITVLVLSFSTPVVAQQSDGDQRETVKTPTMSEAVYNKLLEAQEFIDAQQYDEGLAVLREMESNERASSYERAQVFNFFAYTYFTLERYQDALNYYEKVLAEPEITEALVLNTLYTTAQLYFVMEDYQNALRTIERWLAVAPEPSLNAYMLMGQAYYQLEQYEEALSPLLQARELVRSRGETPKEMLLLLLQNIYLMLENYAGMTGVVRELIIYHPKPDHWRSLASAYSSTEQYDKQMSILEMLYETNNLNARSRMNLGNLFMMHDAPYKAALVMEEALGSGDVEINVRNLQLLAQAWQSAQEMEESIEPLIEATRIAEDGNIHVRLAQSYISLDMYEEAVEVLNAGLRLGGIDRPDQANLMLGMSLFELQRFEAAKNAFASATGDDRSQKAAEDWIKYVESESNRKEQLERSLEQRRS